MTTYFEPHSNQTMCYSCQWMSLVEDHEPPCRYCNECGCEDEPKDFDYHKLKEVYKIK